MAFNGRIKGIIGAVFLSLLFTAIVSIRNQNGRDYIPQVITIPTNTPIPTDTPSPTPTLPPTFIIPQRLHVFQTFNNCGPASLSMLLTYFDIDVSQKELGDKLRPYQIPGGNNDDKSVTLSELAQESKNYGLEPFHRPNGTIELLKQFIAHNIPVVIRTLTKLNEDIGHYRVARGYDDENGEIVQDDSLQGKNLRFSYEHFLSLWQPYNFEYLVLVPQSQREDVNSILGKDIDETLTWKNALTRVEKQLAQDPENIFNQFNVSIASYHVGDYQKSVTSFEQVEKRLPFRMLWYQMEPIHAYFQLKKYDRVFFLTEKIINNDNRAFSELYYLRGLIYQNQGRLYQASQEFEKALIYNRNYQPAKDELKVFN